MCNVTTSVCISCTNIDKSTNPCEIFLRRSTMPLHANTDRSRLCTWEPITYVMIHDDCKNQLVENQRFTNDSVLEMMTISMDKLGDENMSNRVVMETIISDMHTRATRRE